MTAGGARVWLDVVVDDQHRADVLVADVGGGEQSIILRKGGIAEGRQGFSFRHREFFLFPTFFHEQVAKVRIASANLPWAGDTIAIRWYAKVERALRIGSLRTAEAWCAALSPVSNCWAMGKSSAGVSRTTRAKRASSVSPLASRSLNAGVFALS